MISWLWLIPVVFVVFMGGFMLGAVMAAGKRADLEFDNATLRSKLEDLEKEVASKDQDLEEYANKKIQAYRERKQQLLFDEDWQDFVDWFFE